MKIEKVDAHHHLWTRGSRHYPMMSAPDAERSFGNTRGLKHDFDAPQFVALASAENVTRSVYIESQFAPEIEETAFVQRMADEHGFPHAILAKADFASTMLGSKLDVHMQSRLFRGLRTMVTWDANPLLRGAGHDNVLNDAAWRSGYRELGQRGLIAEVMALPAQLDDLAALAEAEPLTQLIVGHAGMPLARDPIEVAAWQSGIAALAALPHVTIKISGLGMANHHWTTASIRPTVTKILTAFGSARCMFGSNFPVDGLYSTYADLWGAFDEITADYASDDRGALFRDTAMRVFSIQ